MTRMLGEEATNAMSICRIPAGSVLCTQPFLKVLNGPLWFPNHLNMLILSRLSIWQLPFMALTYYWVLG
jgi:hypothetical protein